MQQNKQLKDVLESCRAIAEKAGVGVHITAVSATGETASIVHTTGVDIDEAGVSVRTRLPRSDGAWDYATAAEREQALATTSVQIRQIEAAAAGALADLTAAEAELRKRKAWRGSLETMLDVGLKAVEPFHLAYPYTVVSSIIRAWAKYAGGRHHYLPAGRQLDNAIRDEEICRQFTGQNYGELGALHGLTEMRVRQIVGGRKRLPAPSVPEN